MLTGVAPQVNSPTMPMQPSSYPENGTPREHFGWPHVAGLVQRRAPRTVLLIGEAPEETLEACPRHATVVRLGATPDVRCALNALPFAARQFGLVLVRSGLAESWDAACSELTRVVEPGGRLVILGEGHLSLATRIRGHGRQAVKPGPICRKLRQRSFVIEHCEGRGLAGTGLRTGPGWRAPLVGFSDQVFICASRHASGHIIRPVRFVAPQSVGTARTALDGINREAVA